MVKNPASKNSELDDFISNLRKNHRIRFFIFAGFLLLSFALMRLGTIVPPLVVLIITLFLFINIFYEYLAKKVWPKKTVKEASISYFIFQVLEVAAILIAVSEFQGELFGGVTFLLIYVMFCYLGFTRLIYPRILAALCLIGYIIVILLKYLRIVPYLDLQGLGVNPYDDGTFVVLITSFMAGSFVCITFYVDVFSRKVMSTISSLRAKTSEIEEKRDYLQDVNTILGIRVKARTRELRELAKELDEQVQKRTKELQEKVKILEKFQRLSVGRELKMIELKKEIKKLKG